MNKKYYAIKTPEGFVWWIADSEWNAWFNFFKYPDNNGDHAPHCLPIATAKQAYESVGYRCVEIEIVEKRVMPTQIEINNNRLKKDEEED